jgi:type IV pilus assembly protein PilM
MRGGANLSIFGSSNILSLDFGSNSIKGVVGKQTKKGLAINKGFSIDLPENLYTDGEITDLDQMTYLLRSGLSDNKVDKLESYAIVNSTKIVMREVNLPMVSDEELESIINFQLEDYIPINPQDYVVNYLDLGFVMEDGEERKKVLLVGIPRTIILSHLTLMKNVELKPSVMDYHGNAISKLIHVGGEVNDSFPSGGTVACVDIGAKSTNVSIVKEGTVMVSRVVQTGSENIIKSIMEAHPDLERSRIIEIINECEDISVKPVGTDLESEVMFKVYDQIFMLLDSVEMIIRYYKTREVANDVNLIMIYGRFSELKGLAKLFNGFFDVEATVLKYLPNIEFSGDISKYANAIGGLVRRKEVKRK